MVIKLLLLVAIIFLMSFLIKITLTKVFEIEQKSYLKTVANNTQKSINIAVDAILILIFLLLIYLQKIDVISWMLFFGIVFFLGAIRLFTQGYFWWKNDKESRYFVLCIGEALFYIIVGIAIWQFDILGLTTLL